MKHRSQHADGSGAESFPKHVHLLGAGGAGVSGIGRILAKRGHTVTGHDRATSQMFEALDQLGLPLQLGPSTAECLPPDTQLVVRTAAVGLDDPQVLEAKWRGIPVLKYAEALPRMAAPANFLGVAGTHGKTTASWMLWYALDGIARSLGSAPPGALIGGLCRQLGTNAIAGNDEGWFCAEACEYDRSFLRLRPRGAIVTNVEEDHLDCYGTMHNLERAFACFVEEVASDGLVVLGRDVPESVELGGRAACIWRLGRELEVDLLGEQRGCFEFRLRGPGWAIPALQLGVPGHFNVENAALALALAIGLAARTAKVDPATLCAAAARGLEQFGGVHRRFEPWGSLEGVDVVHDYAHHPTEVRVTVEAALRAYPGQPLHILFQPHQHSRTSRFLTEFAESLRAADRVVISDVYGARVHVDGEHMAGAPELVNELLARKVPAVQGGSLGASVEHLLDQLPAKATALVLGAGDIEGIKLPLLDALTSRCARVVTDGSLR